ncbi:hypothetical protein [Megasphaera stantonii]|uniref:hypothetical protein n=1 Tax=Megasphaera stantonii TaxID=2144175 RepID=UPI0023EF5F68|nr:hypothetical protein [Megasphaera stantonii]
MISLQDVKEILLISAFLLVFSRALIIDMKRNFRKKILHVYKYSVSFFVGYFITIISLLGFAYSFYFAIDYAIWLFLSTCMGYNIIVFSTGIVAKYENDEAKYQKKMNIARDMAKYITIVLFALIMKEWFI